MNLSQEFHAHLQSGQLSAAISLVVGQLVELKIVTKANSGTLQTTVDLLSGQIISTVDPAFINDKNTRQLLDFHTNQITATAHLVREQLRSLQDLLAVLSPQVAESIEPSSIVQPTAPEPVIPFQPAEIIFSTQASETLPLALPETVPPPTLVAESNPENPEPIEAITPPLVPTIEPAEPVLAKPLETLPVDRPEPIVEKLPEMPPTTSQAPKQPAVVKLPLPKPESRAAIASSLAAAIAQTSALDPSEAATIPNKFDQALKSAGVRSADEDLHPFTPKNQDAIVQPVLEQPTELIHERELIDLLGESEEDWDEWLLAEDNILSELSDVTRENLPDLEANWLSDPTDETTGSNRIPSSNIARSSVDWDEFMPECADLNTGKNQANVERFRQNLVNDPQLMSELLAELDDLEDFGDGKPHRKNED
jgi:hypothetical protein